MRIGIFHDCLINRGGAERVVIELANYLNADLITAGFNPHLRKWVDIKANIIDIKNNSIKWNNILGFNIEAPLRFFLNRKNFDYDLFIFSGQSSIFGSLNGKNNIWFSHTPNRILYDLKNNKLNNSSVIKKLFYRLYIKIFYPLDQKIILKNFKKIISNSRNVQKRIKKYYHKESTIIYPPIESEKFKFKKFGDFYLAISRLTSEKRMDLIANAFTKMPDKKLIIIGNGPERKNVLEIIKDSPNIRLLDNVNDKELLKLYSNCFATIYMPIDEDFGLVPLEGMASGKSCIAVNEGGCKETVIPNKTGFLIKANEKELIETVKNFDIKKAEKMKNNCINQAKKFDIKLCIKTWEKNLKWNF